MYNAALVMAEQLKSIGIKTELKVMDWPSSVQTYNNTDQGWNFFFTGWGTQPALGGLATMAFFAPPVAVYKPKPGQDDPDVVASWKEMNSLPTRGGAQRRIRQDAEAHSRSRRMRAVRLADQGAGGARERAGLHAVPHSPYVERVVRAIAAR